MNKILYIFVENFSNDKREAFFEKELPYLSEAFEKIIVIPLYEGNKNLTFSNDKVLIKQFNAFLPVNRIKIFFSNFFLILKIYISELNCSHNKIYYLKNFRKLVNILVLRVASADNLLKEIDYDINKAVFYSYWFNQWTLILSILKCKNKNVKIVTRAHGSDYKEEQTSTTLPFRYFQLKQVNAIAPVSQYAKNYLINKFNTQKSKIHVNRLGIVRSKKLAPIDGNVLHIVSCSSLIPLKRVHLIPEILNNISIPVKWDHFGNGIEMDAVKKKCTLLKKSIEVNLHGYIPNEEFKKYLSEVPVSFFINVSSYEGIPVTLMEALSLGIPLIGCDTGGVGEIVGNESGYLITVDFDPKEIALLIENNHKKETIYSQTYRQNAKIFYDEYFNADKNYKKFTEFLFNLN